ncbi:uncharacterized protein J3D65DRAFT_625196 [Phyllosticta citribraziliensis]|uniref:Secreted protein n=1 Tax=Phyllosticta citribraziliensis TaxID=989973 RepID=A0ABR1LRK3_9PEZI
MWKLTAIAGLLLFWCRPLGSGSVLSPIILLFFALMKGDRINGIRTGVEAQSRTCQGFFYYSSSSWPVRIVEVACGSTRP